MLGYLISLLDYSNDFSWSVAKASHAVLLCLIEQGKIRNYTHVDKIDHIRRAHDQRHVSQTAQNFNKNQNTNRDGHKIHGCQFFNLGTCMHSSTHDTKWILYRHICVYCHTKNGKTLSHMESECRN